MIVIKRQNSQTEISDFHMCKVIVVFVRTIDFSYSSSKIFFQPTPNTTILENKVYVPYV
jgi:hypothetical protein